MSISSIEESTSSFMPEFFEKAGEKISGAYFSVINTADSARQKVHNVFRSFLLTCLYWLNPEELRTPLLQQVEALSQQSQALFGSKVDQADTLATKISALSARILIDARNQLREDQTRNQILVRTHKVFFNTLIWLEGEESTIKTQEMLEIIGTTIDDIWSIKTKKYAQLQIQTSETKGLASS